MKHGTVKTPSRGATETPYLQRKRGHTIGKYGARKKKCFRGNNRQPPARGKKKGGPRKRGGVRIQIFNKKMGQAIAKRTRKGGENLHQRDAYEKKSLSKILWDQKGESVLMEY